MSKRAAIIQLHHVGHSNSKIMKLLKAPKSTVCDTILHFQELGTMGLEPVRFHCEENRCNQ